MKKKLLAGMATGLFVFAMVGIASAITFTDTQNLNVIIAEGPIANFFWGDTFSYTHNTPGDFEVPWDTVNSASLSISGYWIDGNNDMVEVEGTAVGTLVPGGSYGDAGSFLWWNWDAWDSPSLSEFDIASAFSTWSTGAPLDVSITANGWFCDGILELSTSTFTLDYDNGTSAAPVPEPATMLLFGTGLVGLAGRKFRKNKK